MNGSLRLLNPILALCACALVSAPNAARAEGVIGTTGGPQVSIEGCYYYEHASFKGAWTNIPQGLQRRYVGDRWNDKISAIACAPGCSLRVWEHRDFTGASKVFAGAIVYVGDDWNDHVSSMKVKCK